MQYAYPKLKAIDHTFGGSGTLNTNATGTEQLASRIASLASKLGTGSGSGYGSGSGDGSGSGYGSGSGDGEDL